jgi:peptidoglycan hydrolase CwlO-like protein
MNKTYIMSIDTAKTILKGALGAMTFGAYHQFNTNKIMELNNEKQNLENKIILEKMEKQQLEMKKQHLDMEKQQLEMHELNKKINKLENSKWW